MKDLAYIDDLLSSERRHFGENQKHCLKIILKKKKIIIFLSQCYKAETINI
jgi:hypothetical protein